MYIIFCVITQVASFLLWFAGIAVGGISAKKELKAAFGGAMRGLVAESGAGAIGGEVMPVCVIPLDGTSILA